MEGECAHNSVFAAVVVGKHPAQPIDGPAGAVRDNSINYFKAPNILLCPISPQYARRDCLRALGK